MVAGAAAGEVMEEAVATSATRDQADPVGCQFRMEMVARVDPEDLEDRVDPVDQAPALAR